MMERTEGIFDYFCFSDDIITMLWPEVSFHIRLRRKDLKIKHVVVLLVLVAALVFIFATPDAWSSDTRSFVSARVTAPDVADKLLSLQAEVGYLRQKLAACGGGARVGKVDHFPPLYVITPTYARPVQRAELTRLAQVFVMVPNLHWILVEDAAEKTELVARFLAESGINHSHLHIATPSDMKIKPKDPHWSKPRGVHQRNLALQWLRDNFRVGDPGVVYFADDDNTYSVQLFGEISATRKVSVFPVGLVGGVMVERPLVASDGAVTGWSVGWGTDRPFATDMAGFAINLSYLLSHTSAKFASSVKIGYLESEFLKHLVHLEDLEAVGGDRVLVWHTRTEQPNLNKEKQFSRLHGHASDHGLVV